MPIPSSGTLSMSTINAEYGRGNNLNAYRGTQYYTSSGGPFTFPNTASAISFSSFYGTQAAAPTYAMDYIVVGGGGGAQGAGGAGWQSSGGGGGGGVLTGTYSIAIGATATVTVAGRSNATGGQSYFSVGGTTITLSDGGGTGQGYNGPGGGPSGPLGSPGNGGNRQGGPGTSAGSGNGPNYTWSYTATSYGIGGTGEIGGQVADGRGWGANGRVSGQTSNNTSGTGVIIFSYVNATQRGTGGTVTSSGSGASTRWFHTFSSSGTYTG